jgi:hypothetical protein
MSQVLLVSNSTLGYKKSELNYQFWLHQVRLGSRGRTRTGNPLVNSEMLYH